MLLPRILILCGIVLPSISAMLLADTEPEEKEEFNMHESILAGTQNTSGGLWQVGNDSLTVSSLTGDGYIFFGDESWQNYVVSATATFVKVNDERRWLAILFRAAQDGSEPWSQFTIRYKSTLGDGTEFAVRKESGWRVRQSRQSEQDSIIGIPRRLRVVVEGSHVKAFLDDKPVVESYFCVERKTGCIGLGVSGCIAKFSDFSIRRLADTPIKNKRTSLKPCAVVAHRGFSAIAPENTIAAMRKAVEAGADSCEFDVRQCRDGVIVLMHDETVERTTDGKGRISDLNSTQIKKLDAGSWKSEDFAGERVPTFAEALNVFEDSNCKPVIEIKTMGMYKEIIDILKKSNMLKRVYVASFDIDVLGKIKNLEPDLKCLLLNSDEVAVSPVQQARSVSAMAQSCKTNMVGLDYRMLSANLISNLRKQDLVVYAWTVDDPDVMKALVIWDIDGIITNKPDLAIEFRQHP